MYKKALAWLAAVCLCAAALSGGARKPLPEESSPAVTTTASDSTSPPQSTSPSGGDPSDASAVSDPGSKVSSKTTTTSIYKPEANIKVPGNINLTGFPIAKEKLTLKIMVDTSAAQPDFNKVKMFQAYEKMTNIHIDWINIPAGSTRQKVMMAFASNSLPDAFLKCGNILDNTTQYTFAKDNMLYNLNQNDNLKNFAPNFYAFYSSKPDVQKALTFEGNAVYSFPQGVEAIPNKVAGKLFINQKWLDKVGMKMPVTLDEFYNVLIAFRDKDPNGNGKKDEIPLSAPNYNYITYMLYGAFGLGNRGVHDTYVDFDEKAGKPRLIAATDAYKEYLRYCNKLYNEGLLDKDIFTIKEAQYVAKQAEGRVGAFCYTNLATIPDDVGNQFVGITQALKGPHGDQSWYPVRSDLHSTGAFVITAACKHPEAAMRWVDYFYSDEGNLMYNYGIEGESYVKTEDGKYQFVDSVYEATKNGLSFDSAVAPYVAVGGKNPIITKEPYFYGREMDPIPNQAANNMVPYFPKKIWPPLIFTPEETYDLSIVSTEIKMYVDKMAASFITGREKFTSWDNYIKRLKTMKMDDMLEIYNNVYKRIQ